ncbi:MAG TPA: type II CAAX endopeptidase family protein [Patescibacteria group bacterium]|nr:type II CAAX endopeptidase family protein [Patescibacteria group bacterium]
MDVAQSASPPTKTAPKLRLSAMMSGLAGWTVLLVAAFFGAQYIVSFVIIGLMQLGLPWSPTSTVNTLSFRVYVYVAMALIIGVVAWYRYRKLSFEQIGLPRLPEWSDIGLSLAGVIVYMLASTIALTLASNIPGFSPDQAQNLGLGRLFGNDLILGFFVLVVLTPLFEEVIFRGFLYGRLRNLQFPWWVSSLAVSVLFGLAHMQWNVGVDVFFLSMVACVLREMTGSIWAGMLLHMVKNFLAFLVTFVFIQGM